MIKIKQATKLGYVEMLEGGVADLSYPNSKTRRGRVQCEGTICPTLTCGCETALYVIDKLDKNNGE